MLDLEPFIAKEMITVQSVIDVADEAITTIVPFPNVNNEELTKIIKYYEQHRNGGDVKEFDDEFVKALNLNELKELVIAVDYLNMINLLELLTQVVADRTQNKSVEFVRNYFGIDNDFTPEEEAKYRKENAWAFRGVGDDDEEEESKNLRNELFMVDSEIGFGFPYL